MAPWRSSYAAVCKTVYTGASPVGASINNFSGRVAELVYAVDLKSAGPTTLRVRVPPRPPLNKTFVLQVLFNVDQKYENPYSR